MSRFSRADKLLLATLLPLFVVVFSLHVREAARTGIAQATIFAVPGDYGGYPLVGGPRLEHGVDRSGLQVGDLLIRVGEVDLSGYGYLGFDAIAVEQAGLSLETPLVYERNGVRHTTRLELIPYPRPFMRIPFLLGMAVVGTIVLLRAPRRRHSRALFLASVSFAMMELHFFGGSRWQSYASLVLFNFGGGVAMWAMLRWTIEFPLEVPDSVRVNRAWAWLGALFVLARLNYVLGGPLPSDVVPYAVLASDGIFLVALLSILTWNTLHASPVGRRRCKWVLFGGYVTTVPMLFDIVSSLIGIEGLEHFETLPYVMVLGAAFPLSILVAIVRYDLFDIDRILSSAASYSLAAAAVLAAAVAAAPAIAAGLSESYDLSEQAAAWLLGGALLVVIPPLARLVRGRFDQLVFPERRRREIGFQQLFVDLSECDSPPELLTLLVARVLGLLQPEAAFALMREKDQLVPLDPLNAPGRLVLPLRGRLALELETHPQPRRVDDATLAHLEAAECSALREAGVAVVIPIREGKNLIGLLCVGPRRSGDIYTSTDLMLLGAAAEKASSELDRLRGVSKLGHERARSAELTLLKEQAEQANLAKSRFLAAASHDLRQPLHALGLFVDRLDSQVTEAQSVELVAKIRTSTESLSDMFTTLLDMSRIDAGGVKPDFGAVDVGRLLSDLESEFAPQASEKGLRFEVQSDGEYAISDAQLLPRILRNLVSNAIRYTQHGRVTVESRQLGTDVEIEVKDSGPGIPMGQQTEIFLEFVQLGAGGDGVGLGLSIVDRLVKMLGHRLTLDSKEGSGTRFTLKMRATDRPDARATSLARERDGSLAGKIVVVIDDDLAILDSTRATLQGWGCSVVVAASGDDALDGIEQRGQPDAILADYRLSGGETGVAAVERIRDRLGRPVPAAIVTGETTPQILSELVERGFVHVSKPVPAVTLRAILTELVRQI